MKFTVKEKTKSTVSIEYEDKSTAVIPIAKGITKDQIRREAAYFNNAVTEFDSIDDVPVNVGEVLEADQTAGTEASVSAEYKEARKYHYPTIGYQLDAAYWSRQGDDTQQKSIDASIKLVKDTIPKTWTGKTTDIPSLMD